MLSWYAYDIPSDTPAAKPRIAITLHRLTGSLLLLSFGVARAVVGYKGKGIASATLDWVLSIFLALV